MFWKIFSKEEIKKLWKPFISLFLIIFLIINWQEVSWIFNYKAVSGIITDFFQKNRSEKISNLTDQKNKIEYSEKENSLEIPKIGISAPLILASSENEVYKFLDRGVVHFPNSVLPGEQGQTIILGHSAPSNWPKIKDNWVFSRLNELKDGDEVFLHFNRGKYRYYVLKKIFLEKGERIPEQNLTNSENVLILISCWPPGKDIKRIAVMAEMED
jgi:LPXTG-site transpeptidase (sortase) family protein